MIYTKTSLGQLAFQNRSVPLTPRQRSAFILFDGKRGVFEVMKAAAGLGVTPEDVSHLVSLGLLETAEQPAAAALPPDSAKASFGASQQAPPAPSASMPALSVNGLPSDFAQVHYSKAYPIATRLTAGLGLRGFRLNLAVEAAGDLDKLRELAPRIRDAVGPEKFLALERALYD